jgi:hypothetical protein
MGGWVLGVETFSETILNNKTRGHHDDDGRPVNITLLFLFKAMIIESILCETFSFLFLDEIEQLFKEWGEIEKQTEAFSFLPNEMLRLYRW